jgi:two-component system nitrate/nitrite response regulator NarL
LAAARGYWLPDDLVNHAAEQERSLENNLGKRLTRRERQVMALVAEGLSNKEIARRLNVAEGTVKTHLHNIYGKVGVANRTALAAVAISQPEREE